MAKMYRFCFTAWSRNLDYFPPECGDLYGDFEDDAQALVAAEAAIEEKLKNSTVRRLNCVVEEMKAKNIWLRVVKSIFRPAHEFHFMPAEPHDTLVLQQTPMD